MGIKNMISKSCHCAMFCLGEEEVVRRKRALAHRARSLGVSSRLCCAYILSPLFPQLGICASPG